MDEEDMFGELDMELDMELDVDGDLRRALDDDLDLEERVAALRSAIEGVMAEE